MKEVEAGKGVTCAGDALLVLEIHLPDIWSPAN